MRSVVFPSKLKNYPIKVTSGNTDIKEHLKSERDKLTVQLKDENSIAVF